MLYVIWSMEHGAWWAPGRMGYVQTVDRAGRYSRDEAERIIRSANLVHCHEAMIPITAITPDPFPDA